MLKDKLKEELKQSMLAKDTTQTSVLRMLISAIGYFEIQKGGAGYEATDEDVMTVIQKDVKQRKDAIEQFTAGNRQDLVDKETQELSVLQKYLPEQMNEDDLKKLVANAIQQTNATSMQDLGKVMGVLMPQVKGKADGGMVSKLVKEALTK